MRVTAITALFRINQLIFFLLSQKACRLGSVMRMVDKDMKSEPRINEIGFPMETC